jgi:hypothetical protein
VVIDPKPITEEREFGIAALFGLAYGFQHCRHEGPGEQHLLAL